MLDLYFKNLGKVKKPRCADTIGSAFVFLHLLEGYAESSSDLFLVKALFTAPIANSPADMYVY